MSLIANNHGELLGGGYVLPHPPPIDFRVLILGLPPGGALARPGVLLL